MRACLCGRPAEKGKWIAKVSTRLGQVSHAPGGKKSWESSPKMEGLAPRVPPSDSFLQSQRKAGYRGSDAKGRHVWWRAREEASGQAA